jgi:hypothetical protein
MNMNFCKKNAIFPPKIGENRKKVFIKLTPSAEANAVMFIRELLRLSARGARSDVRRRYCAARLPEATSRRDDKASRDKWKSGRGLASLKKAKTREVEQFGSWDQARA